ncbi:MAG: hypothetical protein AB1374_04840 [Bacillota bacterium]
MKGFKSEADLKRYIVSKVGQAFREEFWQVARYAGYVHSALDEQEAVEDLLDFIRKQAEIHKKASTRKQTKGSRVETREIPPDHRLVVLSEIIAAEAARLPEVLNFREKVLGGNLLPLDKVPSWIEKQKGKATVYVKVPLPHKPEDLRDWFISLATIPEEERPVWPVEYQTETLAYPVPGDNWVHRVPIDKDSPLGHLKQVVTKLTTRYPWWQEAQAVAFVLTGAVPLLPKARVTTSYYSHMPPRITLELDPRLSSQEVAEIYVKARNEVFRGRDKLMTEKHLTLAVFLAENATGETWTELMAKWNHARPEWEYTDYRWFCRDARAAFKRVTGRDWTPPAKPE